MIYTWSKFNYGQTSTLSTQNILFTEGSSTTTLTAVIAIGSYTLTQYVQAIADAMNSVGNLVYATTVDRSSNVLTISASGTFSLLTSQSGTAFGIMGFTQSADLKGAATYSGATACGSQYFPQFMLQSYVPSTNYAQSVSATINESATGRPEVVRFGVNRFIELELKFITNLRMDGRVIKNDPAGLTNALAFLDFASSKSPFEFVPDVNQPATVTQVLLEKTEAASDGTGYKLKELFSEKIPDVYESGLITLRVIS